MKKYILLLAACLSFALLSCKDDDDKGSIEPVSNISSQPYIGGVILTWTNPTNSDYYCTLISYVNAAGETVKKKVSHYDAKNGVTTDTVKGFDDANTYTFTLTAYNVNGGTSTPMTVQGTPQDASMAYYYIVNTVTATQIFQGIAINWVNEYDVPAYINIAYTDGNGISHNDRYDASKSGSVNLGGILAETTVTVSTENAKGDKSPEQKITSAPSGTEGELDNSAMKIHDISSVWQAGYEGEKMLDRDLTSYWHTVLTGYPHWVVFDLGSNYFVNWLELVRRAADSDHNETAAPTSIKWEYSLDGSTFTDLGTYEFDNTLQFNHTYNFETPFFARYVKLTCLSGSQGWAHMAEFLAYYGKSANHYTAEAAAELGPVEEDPDDDPTIDENVEYLTFNTGTVNQMKITQSEENKYEYTIETTGGDPFCSLNPLTKPIAGTVLVFHYQTTDALGGASEFFWCDAGGGPAGGRETALNIPKNNTGEWKTFKINLADAMATHNWAGNVGDYVRFDMGGKSDVTIKIRNIHFREARDSEK